MTVSSKVLGSILGSAIGDAMGAATELRSKELIKEFFGGEVRDIITPPDDTFSRGSKAGSVTDDFSLIYYTTKAIIDNNGTIDDQVAKAAVLNWAEDEAFFNKYAGPTTRAAVDRMKGKTIGENYYDFICCDNAKASNGSSMKISPAGFFNPGNIDKAINDAIIICRPTHNNNLSISGACAIAAAVSEAMKQNATVYSIIQSGLYGAKRGLELSKGTCDILAGPSVHKRINLAVDIALNANSLDEATTEIADVVGSGLHISEAVPSVFGIILAAKGDSMESIIGAVNIGSDTDTIASMVGAIVGALNGCESFSEKHKNLIESVNNYDLTKLSDDVVKIIEKN